ncbi:hypothetical protein GH714_038411 [Hevea brasiliensis]|uniref:CCHC-type domain-containing protein n=1 Tax=Hevea brasiliensis TaxID=3981 RepID=A0A6A6MN66_HEVBR|nr:hypothetical protein GH714_038411 [Hevea brasiliensis]
MNNRTPTTNAATAKDAWMKLETIFSSRTRTQVMQLQKQMKHLKKGTDSIDSYMRRAKTLFDQLAVLQAPVTEDSLVSDILEGLSSEYRPFVRAIEARNESIGFDELYALLLSEETQLKSDTESVMANIPPTAPIATSFPTQATSKARGKQKAMNNRNSAPGGPLICHNCRGQGHMARQCPSPKNQFSNSQQLRMGQQLQPSSGPQSCYAASPTQQP